MFHVRTNIRAVGVPKAAVDAHPSLYSLEHKTHNQLVVFHHDDPTTVALNKAFPEANIPLPMMCYFDWPMPSDWSRTAHQDHMAVHMAYALRAFCFGDIGVGKTASAIWALLWSMQTRGYDRVLVFGPKSSLVSTWKREFFKIAPKLETMVVRGSADKKQRIVESAPPVLIANPESLLNLKHQYAAYKPQLVIVDELTYFKSWKSQRTVGLRMLLEDPTVRLWMMSGSPMPQSPLDIWAPGRMVCPDRMPLSEGAFKTITMYSVPNQKSDYPKEFWYPRKNADQLVADMIGKYAVRYSRDDCLDLPPTTYDVFEVEPTAEQKRVYKKLEKEMLVLLEDGMINAVNAGVVAGKLMQVSMGAVKGKALLDRREDAIVKVDCATKFQALQDTIDATDGPLIIFCPFLAPLDVIEEWMTKKGYAFHRVDGGTSDKARLEAFDAVQKGTHHLLGNPAAFQHSITLTRSNTIFWWGLPTKNEVFQQANGRITRQSQTRKTFIRVPVCTPIEKRTMKSLSDKGELQANVLDIISNL